MPKTRTNQDRTNKRYTILRQLGVPFKAVMEARNSVARFCALLREKGVDPAQYGDLAERLPSGQKRTSTPAALARRERYWALKDAGADAASASAGSQSAGCYDRMMRRLKRGIPLDGVRLG